MIVEAALYDFDPNCHHSFRMRLVGVLELIGGHRHGVTVAELTEETNEAFGASWHSRTIRRDLNTLCAMRLVRRETVFERGSYVQYLYFAETPQNGPQSPFPVA